jgi:hypothetical protein
MGRNAKIKEHKMYTSTLASLTIEQVKKLNVNARPEYTDSVYKFGVIEPIILTKYQKKLYMIAGRRRVASLLAAYDRAVAGNVVEDMPWVRAVNAVIYDNVDPANQAALAYIENQQRSENIVGAWELMREAQKRGDWDEVAQIANLNKGYSKQLEKLNQLNTELIDGYKAGRVAKGNLYECAKLGKARQEYLAGILAAKGKIVSDDIKGAKTAQANAVLATRPQMAVNAATAPVQSKSLFLAIEADFATSGDKGKIFDDFNTAYEFAVSNSLELYRLVKVA